MVARSRHTNFVHICYSQLFSVAIFYLVLLLTCLIITVWQNFYYCFSLAFVISCWLMQRYQALLPSFTLSLCQFRLWGAHGFFHFAWLNLNPHSPNKKHSLRFCERNDLNASSKFLWWGRFTHKKNIPKTHSNVIFN